MRSVLLALLSVTVAAANPYGKVTKGNGFTYTRLGNPVDVTTPTTFGVLFEGGGTDVNEAYIWMCAKAGNGDFLVIRATGTADYNTYIQQLCPAINSVSTLEIYNRTGAQNPFVLQTISQAEAIFFAGGAQNDYITFYSGNVSSAVNAAAARGIPVGGTSAGNAILAQFAYSALTGSVASKQALANPYTPLITISDGFLDLTSLLQSKITDDHFVTRDRMGRLVTFLARIIQDGSAASPRGIGLDEQTAFLMEADGTGSVVGYSTVYFLSTPGPPETCKPGTPLTFQNLSVYRVSAGDQFDIVNWTGSGGVAYTVSAVDGVLQSTQPGGSVY